MMKRVLTMTLIIMMVVLLISGCSKEKSDIKQADSNSEIGARYLKEKEYEIISNNDKVFEYILEKKDLLYLPYQLQWALQNVNQEDYVGKKIDIYEVIVKNHVLDDIKGNNKKQTIVHTMIVNNQMIGGYAMPDFDVAHYGGVYSLEGKTLEEITGISYQEWQAEWANKYR